VLRKDDNEWVKKCVLGDRPRGRPMRTWKGDMKSLKSSKEDALVCDEWI